MGGPGVPTRYGRAAPAVEKQETIDPWSIISPERKKQIEAAASTGLELKRRGYGGARNQGLERGRQLAGGEPVTIDDLQVMRAWFARHVRTSYPSYKAWRYASPSEKDKKDRWHGAVAWLLWGGTPAYNFVMSDEVQRQIVANGKRDGRRLKVKVKQKKNLLE